MSLAALVARARRGAESRMTDACTITPPDATPTWNPTTETYDTDSAAETYTGPCRVKMPRAMSLEPDAGDRTRVVIRPEIHIPASVEGVQVGDRVTIRSSAFNASLQGSVFRVTSLFHDSQASAQRLECTEEQA